MYAGIPELTLQHDGYLLWRDVKVEHYSHPYDPEYRESHEKAAREVARCCRHLEAIGVPVTSNHVVWKWSWFETMEANDPLKSLLASGPSFYQEGITAARSAESRAASVPMPDWDPSQAPTGRIGWTIGDTFHIWDGARGAISTSPIRPDEDGVFYHVLRAQGWHIADCGQAAHLGCCYATLEGVRAFLTAHGYPAELEGKK